MYTRFLFTLALIAPAFADYNLALLPLADRESICNKNTAFCLNACLQKTSSNLCAVDTMQFSCVCQDGKLPVDVHYFPIQAQQCVGENQDCRNECATRKTRNEIDACSNLCDQHFVCGTPNAAEQTNFQASDETVASVIHAHASSSSHSTSSSSSSALPRSTFTSTTSTTTSTTSTSKDDSSSTNTATPYVNGAKRTGTLDYVPIVSIVIALSIILMS